VKFELRRKDREVVDREAMKALLARMTVGRLGLSTEEGPYVVPMNYIYSNGCIYLHSAQEGRKISILRKSPAVCFLVDKHGPLVLWSVGCFISQIYESVMCFGHAELMEDEQEKRRILEEMVRKLTPPGYTSPPLNVGRIRQTAVVRVRVEQMTGKARRPDTRDR
jgi:nitroimidazol reductase NimA-like FMN-containing flavoprotein (pyridoxamine 5'-phosphate oxidase superfamily)